MLHVRDRQRRADFVLGELPEPRRSDDASNMIPRSAVVRNGVSRIAPIGTMILSVNDALDVRQGTDRLLQQNLPLSALSICSKVCVHKRDLFDHLVGAGE